MNKNYYEVLEIEINSSDEDIKKTFRKLATKYHPDKHANSSESERKIAEEKFKEINEANGILGDVEKRKKYDLGLKGNSNNKNKKTTSKENPKEKKSFRNESEIYKSAENNSKTLEGLKREGNARKNSMLNSIFKNI